MNKEWKSFTNAYWRRLDLMELIMNRDLAVK